jgi:DNA-directed RNA polymerase specialized sigma24 family protein
MGAAMDDLVGLGRLARKGDEAAYDKLYDLLYSRVYFLAARYIPERSRVEVVVEEVLLLAILSLVSTVQFQDTHEVLRFVFDITREHLAAERRAVKQAS